MEKFPDPFAGITWLVCLPTDNTWDGAASIPHGLEILIFLHYHAENTRCPNNMSSPDKQ